MPRKETVKCNWCGEMLPVSEVVVVEGENDYGTVVERKCPHCGGILAAYLKEEGDFLMKIRTF